MKKILFSLSLIFASHLGYSQCSPDPVFVSQGVGVYPLPDSTCNNSVMAQCQRTVAYNFVFTAVVPDTLTVPFGGGEITVDLDFIKVTNVAGLPTGLSYSCNTTDCKFENNTSGCVLISGTTTDTAGIYNITVTADVRTAGLAPFTLPFTFPDATIAPGCYKLIVVESVDIQESYSSAISCIPNPFQNSTMINFDTNHSGDATLNVMNMNGQTVKTEIFPTQSGSNSYTLDATNLSSGVYYVTVSSGDTKFLNKIVINK